MLEVRGVRTAAGGPVDLAVRRGEIVAIRGPSGAGKTLLLRAIADLDPVPGEVLLEGVPQARIPAPEWRRRVAYVPAEPGWWADRVRAHFADPEAALPLVEALGLPPEALDWEVRRLSTGERQRLALARALALAPEVWLLDEPTGALDAEATARVEALLRRGREEGRAILIVTHDAAQAERLADRTLTMEAGGLSAPAQAA